MPSYADSGHQFTKASPGPTALAKPDIGTSAHFARHQLIFQPDDKGDHQTRTGSGIDMKGQTMARQPIALTIPDLSAFTKTLRTNLLHHDGVPSHAKMLSMLAKAAGYANYQHLKADMPAPSPKPDNKRLERALRVFDDEGIMTRWPKQTAIQGLCLWAFWSRLPSRQNMAEAEVNAILQSGSSFDDHVLLRRSLVDHRLVRRTKDGRIYRRIEQAPPPEAAALIAAVQRPSNTALRFSRKATTPS